MNNERLYIKHFGPIIETEVLFNKVTVFIGEQGSGKSTVAKLFSLFSWLEKALVRRILTEKYVIQYARFKKNFCAFNGLTEYFYNDTVIQYDGIHYSFTYQDDKLFVEEIPLGSNLYHISKVMYVPAERAIIGSVDHAGSLKGVNDALRTFIEEYENAKRQQKSGYDIPFGNVKFKYDQLNDIPRLVHSDYDIRLSVASSGYQSSLPLLLVSKNLTNMVGNSKENAGLSAKEMNSLRKEVETIMQMEDVSEDVRKASLQTLTSRYSYTGFINVVEEMELNLYPDSQKTVLYELIQDAMQQSGNKLVLTTHSPYVINYLTLAVKAKQVSQRSEGSEIFSRLNVIVPAASQLDPSDLTIYEMSGGVARLLANYEGLPSDDNYLNEKLNDSNSMFDALLEIEEEIG